MLRRAPARLADVLDGRVPEQPRDGVEPQPAAVVEVGEADRAPQREGAAARRHGHEHVHVGRQTTLPSMSTARDTRRIGFQPPAIGEEEIAAVAEDAPLRLADDGAARRGAREPDARLPGG